MSGYFGPCDRRKRRLRVPEWRRPFHALVRLAHRLSVYLLHSLAQFSTDPMADCFRRCFTMLHTAQEEERVVSSAQPHSQPCADRDVQGAVSQAGAHQDSLRHCPKPICRVCSLKGNEDVRSEMRCPDRCRVRVDVCPCSPPRAATLQLVALRRDLLATHGTAVLLTGTCRSLWTVTSWGQCVLCVYL